MAPRSRAEFAELLRGLGRAEFESFVAAVWRARGHEVRVVEGTLVVEDPGGSRRGGEPRRLAIEPPAGPLRRRVRRPATPRTSATDGVITADRRSEPSDPGRRHVDADELYDLVYYAIGSASRDRLFREYFDRPASVPRSAGRERSGGDRADRVVVMGSVVVVVAALLGGVWISGTLPGSAAGGVSPTPAAGTAATPGVDATDVTPATTSRGTAEPTVSGTADIPLLTLSGEGERARTEFVPSNFSVDERVTVIRFKHAGPGPYSVWVSNDTGHRRPVVAGNGSADATVLLDLDRGEYDLHVLAEDAWVATVSLSEPPAVVKNPFSVAEVATTFGGPIGLDGPRTVTVYGRDPNASYRARLNTRQGTPIATLVNTTGDRTPVRTNVTYEGPVYVEVTSLGEWRIVIREREVG